MNNQIKQLLEKWSASINEKKYRETAQYYEPLTCKPKYETHARAIKRAARRWHSRSDSCGLNPIWQIGRDDGVGDNDTSSQPLDDWRGVSAARAKWCSGAMTLCRKRLGVRSKEKHDGDSSSKCGDCPLNLMVIKI